LTDRRVGEEKGNATTEDGDRMTEDRGRETESGKRKRKRELRDLGGCGKINLRRAAFRPQAGETGVASGD
jgi:hypothetical protein